MDLNLIAALNNKIDTLDPDKADLILGLKPVALHIEAAFKHLLRGQKEFDYSAFNDAVYRTNLAFDCCIKEAYHTLAGRNPSSKSLIDIENYLTSHKIFRSRILKLFTDYRQQWRRESDCDDVVSFDQSEAFMAITTVSSFAFLLIDQFNEHQSYLRSQAKGKIYSQSQECVFPARTDLLSRTANVVEQFCASHSPLNSLSEKYSEEQLIAALHGFISSVAPELSVILKGNLPLNSQYHAALIIIRGQEKVLFKLKHNVANENLHNLSVQTEQDMSTNGIRYGILFCFSNPCNEFRVEERQLNPIRGRLIVFSS